MKPDQIKQLIQAGLGDAEVYVEGDDGRHFSAVIVSSSFAGKTMLQQHKMVYGTLGDAMQGAVHALSMRTYTPEEWQKVQNSRPQ